MADFEVGRGLPGAMWAAFIAANALKVMLCNSSNFDDSASMATIASFELPSGNGYTARLPFLTTAAGAYDPSQLRYEEIPFNVKFTASGGSLQFDRIVVFYGGSSVIGNTSGFLAGYAALGATVTVLNGIDYNETFYINVGKAGANVTAA